MKSNLPTRMHTNSHSNGTHTRAKDSKILHFARTLRSSVKIYFTEEVSFAGVSAYRFQAANDLLRDIGPDFGNECFCINQISSVPKHKNGCLLQGALDLSTCQGIVWCISPKNCCLARTRLHFLMRVWLSIQPIVWVWKRWRFLRTEMGKKPPFPRIVEKTTMCL